MYLAGPMKCRLGWAVENWRQSQFPICDFNYKTWFWQHVKTPELSKALLTYHTHATSVFCTELLPKEATVSEELQGAESLAKTRPQDMEDHELESLTINPLFIQFFWLSKHYQLVPSSQILLESTSLEITIAFPFYKPISFFTFSFQHSDLEVSVSLTIHFIAQHFLLIWK